MTAQNNTAKRWNPTTSHLLKGTQGAESYRGKPPAISANYIKKHYRYDAETGKFYFKRLNRLPEYTKQRRGKAIRGRREHIERWNARYADTEVKLTYNPAQQALVIHMQNTDYHTGKINKLQVNAAHVAWYFKMGYWPGSIKFFNTDWSDLRWHNLYIPRRRWNSLLARMKSPMEAVPDMPSHMFNPDNPFGHYYRKTEERLIQGDMRMLPVGGWQLKHDITYLQEFSVNRGSGRHPSKPESDTLAWKLVRAQRDADTEYIPFVNDPETVDVPPKVQESPIARLRREHNERRKT